MQPHRFLQYFSYTLPTLSETVFFAAEITEGTVTDFYLPRNSARCCVRAGAAGRVMGEISLYKWV
jgi:hypothetical protein